MSTEIKKKKIIKNHIHYIMYTVDVRATESCMNF